MNLQFYLEKLSFSDEFKKFMKENPDAYLCSGFFVIDKNPKSPDNKVHLDYFVPKGKKIFSFQFEEGIKLIALDKIDEKILEKISEKCEFEFEDMEKIISKEMEKQNVKNKIQKIMFSLQKNNGKNSLIGTIFISGLGMLKVNIDIFEKKIIEFEKKSLFDIIKVGKGK